VWALGSWHVPNSDSYNPLVERWDGKQWSIVPEPQDEQLIEAVAISPTVIWVGTKGLLYWDDQQWSKPDSALLRNASAPQPGRAALSPYDAWGSEYLQNGQHPWEFLLFHWDGQLWRNEPLYDNTSDYQGRFAGLGAGPATAAAISSDDVWTIGQ